MKKDTFMICRDDEIRGERALPRATLAPGSGCYRRLPSKYPINIFAHNAIMCSVVAGPNSRIPGLRVLNRTKLEQEENKWSRVVRAGTWTWPR